MKNRRDFLITDNHIKLLKRMWVNWQDCEYGAPAVDCKRPYGNSDVEDDICEILGWVGTPDGLNDARNIHTEMLTVVQIALNHPGEDIMGLWIDERGYGIEWVRATKSHEKNLKIAILKKTIETMEEQASAHEFKMQGLRGEIEESLLPQLNELLGS
jgi:hypothetical protein